MLLLVRLKRIFIGLFVIGFMAIHPAEGHESVREVEETGEVKLYIENKQYRKQKPKPQLKRATRFQKKRIILLASHTLVFEKYPKYILYCNLIYYE